MKAKERIDYNKLSISGFEVLGDRYLVELVEPTELMVGDILIPDRGEVERKWAMGRIVGVGNGHRLERDVTVPMFYGVGDLVIFERLTGKDFFFGHGEYRMMSQIDVLARIPNA